MNTQNTAIRAAESALGTRPWNMNAAIERNIATGANEYGPLRPLGPANRERVEQQLRNEEQRRVQATQRANLYDRTVGVPPPPVVRHHPGPPPGLPAPSPVVRYHPGPPPGLPAPSSPPGLPTLAQRRANLYNSMVGEPPEPQGWRQPTASSLRAAANEWTPGAAKRKSRKASRKNRKASRKNRKGGRK